MEPLQDLVQLLKDKVKRESVQNPMQQPQPYHNIDDAVHVKYTKEHHNDPMHAYFKSNNEKPAFPEYEDMPRVSGVAFDVYYIPIVTETYRTIHRLTLTRRHIKYSRNDTPIAGYVNGELVFLYNSGYDFFFLNPMKWNGHFNGIVNFNIDSTKIRIQMTDLTRPSNYVFHNYAPDIFQLFINDECTFMPTKKFKKRRMQKVSLMGLGLPLVMGAFCVYALVGAPIMWTASRLTANNDCVVRKFNVVLEKGGTYHLEILEKIVNEEIETESNKVYAV